MKPTAASRRRRQKLVAIVESLPEVEITGDAHLAFRVRKKTFGYYLFDHHGDGKVALACKAPRGELAKRVAGDPERFFVPPYLGARGWLALRLDADVDWDEVGELVFRAYRLTAPKSLAAAAV
jgi:hypothetical protein